MKMYVETLAPYRVAYVRHIGPYGIANASTMEQLKQWANQRNLLTDSAILLGIAQDNPLTTPPAHCRYDACIVISDDFTPETNTDIEVAELSGGQYLICTVKHTAEDIRNAWEEIIPHVQEKGYRIESKPMIERYRPYLLNQHLCELCIPITMV